MAPDSTLAERRTQMTFGLVAAIYTFYLFLVLYSSFAQYLTDTSPTAEPAWQFIYYFTNQSNILVMLWLTAFAVANLGSGGLATKARVLVNKGTVLGLTLYMMVVFFIVSFVLNPFYDGSFEPVPTGGGLYVHVVSPIMMLMIFLLYPWEGTASWRTVLGWMGYLLFYVVLVNVVGSQVRWRDGTRAYPYDFINPYGYSNVFVYAAVILGLTAVCFLVGIALLYLKNRFDDAFRPKPHG